MMRFGLASRRWGDCIQLYARFVSLIFCLFHPGTGFICTARNLPVWSVSRRKVIVSIGLTADWDAGTGESGAGQISVFYCVQFSLEVS
ncbi:hypothetical protein EGM97_25165 [Pseudomonas sp. AF32]|nr:hypothetical protein [Pseudomonas sp. AF32]